VVRDEPLTSEGESLDVRISVEEVDPGTVEFGFGYGEYERLRGFLDVSYRNLFGMNRKGTFRTEQSSLESRFILSYDEPWLFGRPIASRTTLQSEEREERNIDTGETRYELRSYTAGTGVERALGKPPLMREPASLAERTTLGLYYEYSLVDTFNVQPDVVLSREDTGTLAISSLSPSIIYDSRDNPFDPQRGLLAGTTVKAALEELVSETDFVKVSAHASAYHRPLRWLVLALSLKGGLAEGFRETEELPLVERFFLGGRDTVRGYDEDELGPKGEDDNPTGGNAFFLSNVEFRLRVTPSWRTVLFLDGGNVWVDTGDFDLSDLLFTAGIGLQYNTPVGPIRLDYGHKLDRQPGESRGELHFSIGHAF
jgi:outer membrane protein insertion porin family